MMILHSLKIHQRYGSPQGPLQIVLVHIRADPHVHSLIRALQSVCPDQQSEQYVGLHYTTE